MVARSRCCQHKSDFVDAVPGDTIVAMATYAATGDDYAGWSTGRNFGAFGLVAGLVGLTGWAAMHGHLPGLQPKDAGDQLLIVVMEWVGIGCSS